MIELRLRDYMFRILLSISIALIVAMLVCIKWAMFLAIGTNDPMYRID